MLPINLGTVSIATVAAFILGFLLHGPVLGKLWMKLADIHPTGNEKLSDMVPQMLANFLTNFVTAYVLAVVYLFSSSSPYLNDSGISGGIICAVLVWFGFIVTSTSIEMIWMGRTLKLWLFEAFCSLMVMMVMGAIIAA